MYRRNKTQECIIILALTIFMHGCAYYFGAPVGGVILTDLKGPISYDAGPMESDYEILGEVTGEAKVSTFLGIIAVGDASIASAYKNALKKIPGANALINVKVDYRAQSVLTLVANHTTIVSGIAIRTDKISEQTTQEIEVTAKQPAILQPAPPKIPIETPEPVSKEVLDFRQEILKTLQNDRKLLAKFTSWAKSEGKPETPDQWVTRLDEKALRFFNYLRLPLKDWLGRLFDNKIALK